MKFSYRFNRNTDLIPFLHVNLSLCFVLREKLIRLQHENNMLKLAQEGSDNEKIALLQSLLEDANSRKNELETENRCTLHTIHYTLHTTHYTPYTTHYTLYTRGVKLKYPVGQNVKPEQSVKSRANIEQINLLIWTQTSFALTLNMEQASLITIQYII